MGVHHVTPTSRIDDASLDRLWRPFSPPGAGVDDGGPLLFRRGSAVWLETDDGRRLLDGVGALEAMAVGHGCEELVEVAAAQMRELAFLDVFRHLSQPALDLADELVRVTPDGLETVHFTRHVRRDELRRRLLLDAQRRRPR